MSTFFDISVIEGGFFDGGLEDDDSRDDEAKDVSEGRAEAGSTRSMIFLVCSINSNLKLN